MQNRGTNSAPLIDGILNSLPNNIDKDRLTTIEQFITLYYEQIPESDLSNATPEDFGGAAISHWQLMQERKPGEHLVKIYNPQLEQHGWQCPHTVIEVVVDDKPHLVNSISMAVLERNINIHLTVHPVLRVERNSKNKLAALYRSSTDAPAASLRDESVIHMEIDRQARQESIDELTRDISRVLFYVNAIDADKNVLEAQSDEMAERLLVPVGGQSDPEGQSQEAASLLQWLDEKQFSVFGSANYALDQQGKLSIISGSEHGLLRNSNEHIGISVDATVLAEFKSRQPGTSPVPT